LIGLVQNSGCSSRRSREAVLEAIRDEQRRGNLDAALHDADRQYRKYEGHDSEWAWRFRIEKAHILVFQGAYNNALELLTEDLPDFLANSDVAVRRKIVQAIAHDALQKYDDADRELNEAAKVSNAYPALLGDIAQARGNLAISRKDYPEAAVAFQRALAISREQKLPSLEANALGGLGYLAMWQEHYDEAIERFKAVQRALESLKSTFALNRTFGNLGWSYLAIGDLQNAEIKFSEAERASAKAAMPEDRAYWLHTLGDTYYRQGRYVEAEAVSQQALALERQMDDKRTLTECLNTLSEIALATGHVELAENHNREALGIERAGLDQFGIAPSTIIAGRIAAGRRQYPEAERTFRTIIADHGVETALRWEAQAGLAQVHAAKGNTALAEREFGESIRTITVARNGIQNEEFRLSFLSSAIRFYDAYVNFLIEHNRPLDALGIADLSRAQTLERGLSSGSNVPNGQSSSLAPQEIARRWKATLLFYWLGEERSHLWVITGKEVSLLPLPGRAEIDATVKSYLDSFTFPRDPLEAGNTDGKKLYATLIEPAERLIPKNSRVIVLPDGKLNSLNFETLIVPGENPHYWIEDVTLLTGNSLALLAKASPALPPQQANLFLMGDALEASPDFPPLPQAGKEVGLVQSHFAADRRTVFTGAQAVPSQFLSGKPEGFSYLHFATHGTASTIRPLESAVILSPEGDTYKLYAREVVQHPMHAYLVTISACNGAGMKTYAGEGLVGLAWAFLRAGAHNVVAGLWEVSNASTPQLMDELYKGLHEGKDPASALRAAKLTLVHSAGNYRRPFYWAPFQLYAGS